MLRHVAAWLLSCDICHEFVVLPWEPAMGNGWEERDGKHLCPLCTAKEKAQPAEPQTKEE